MIPLIGAGIEAFRGLTPLVKAGIVVGLLVTSYGALQGVKAYQRYLGREEQKERERVELMRQQQEAITQTMRQLDLSQKQSAKIEEEKNRWRLKALKVQEEKDRYVRYTDAKTLDPAVVDLVNQFARVLNDATPNQHLPPAGAASAEPSVDGQAPATTVDAFDRLAELTDRLADCEQTHKGLSDWAIEQYQVAAEDYMKNGHR